jgi:hypothetical protein
MGTHRVNFIKSNNNWFVDFIETELTPKINGANQQHLMHLVGGWDTWLEVVSNGSDNVWLTFSDSPILNGTEVKKLDKTEYNGIHGVYYFLESYNGVNLNVEFWACSPGGFEFGFGYLPTSWYFIKHD